MNTPLFHPQVKYCVRCCVPETEEGVVFDELGICQACRSSEEKMHINWKEREHQLRQILDEARDRSHSNYDCIVPISGGKDSVFQLHVLCNVYKMKPLAVTFNHNWYSKTGWYNLLNALEQFDVDHIMFTPNRKLVNKLSLRSLRLMGDPCWHCHMGCGTFPFQIALKFKIPLLVYGEPSSEGHNVGSYIKPIVYDKNYFLKISAKIHPDNMVCENITSKDIHPFQLPEDEECDQFPIKGIHLGNYIFWDEERQTEFIIKNYDWRETEIEQAYKHYKSAECVMPGMHDFTCYLKRGYARATGQANNDIRQGLLTRQEGFSLISDVDPCRPQALDYFLKITGISEEEFYSIMKQHRLKQLKDVEIPVTQRENPVSERIYPFFSQIIDELKSNNTPDYSCKSPSDTGIDIRFNSFLDVSIRDLRKYYRLGKITPRDIANMVTRLVGEYEDSFHAFAYFDADVMMQSCLSTMNGPGNKVHGFLEGIPVAVKDVFNTKDYPTQMGSQIWKDFTPGNNARIVDNLIQAGAFIAGKTATAEFAVHALGDTINPHHKLHTPGTSSSGSAVAVATGMVPTALGTQTAGSITRPASFCGIYGCKPSFGLIPRTGVLKTADSLDTLGFFTAFYEDLQLIWRACCVAGHNYPMSDKALSDHTRQNKPKGVPWKVGFIKGPTWHYAESYAKDAVLSFVDALSAMPNVAVSEPTLPELVGSAHDIHATIYNKSLSYYFKNEIKSLDFISPVFRQLVATGNAISPDEYRAALEQQTEFIEAMDTFFGQYDIIVSLGTSSEAPLRDVEEKPDMSLVWTLAHLPVISAPTFVSPNGLPFGVQLAARKYNDLLLFNFCNFVSSNGLIPKRCNPVVFTGAHS